MRLGGLPVCDPLVLDIPLPSGWAKNAKSAVLHVISLAHYAIVTAGGWAANSINARVRLTSHLTRSADRCSAAERAPYLSREGK